MIKKDGNDLYEKNMIIELDVTDMGSEGQGIGRIDGFTFFVKDALPSDHIEARILKVKKNYAYAKTERVITPSPFRVTPACGLARKCGGCQIMELSYEKQLEYKENKVKSNLVRIGGFDKEYIDSITEPIAGMEGDALRYRNKAQFPFGKNKEGKTVCGFYAGRTHDIIPVTDCKLGIKENEDILKCVMAFMDKNHIEPYDEKTGKGLLRHVLIRKGFATGEIMVCMVINGDNIPGIESLADELKKINVCSISYSINKKNTNVIMGDNYHTLYGKDTISDVMHVRKPEGRFKDCYSDAGITFNISPLSFYQVNPVQVEKLYGIAIDYADLKGDEEVWDLCCGIGTISLSMAGMAKKVHGIEIVPEAIEDAKVNMINNHIENAEFICAPAEEYLTKHEGEIRADVIVMDPPRKGMEEEALRVVVNTSPERIVYVSCDSATLARDLKYLCENGYELKKVRACDMFGQTYHVETCALITRVKKN